MKAFPSKQEASRKFLGVKGGVPQFDVGQDACEAGMDLRDYFAAKAMGAIILHPHGPAGDWEQAAKDAYEAADEMMKAREAK